MAEQIRYDFQFNFGQGITNFKELEAAIKRADAELKNATFHTQEFAKASTQLTALKTFQVQMQGMAGSTANAGVALQNLNFVIRDSPYFFRDFSLGILAVGNNLNPLIDSMLRMKREAQEVGQTLSGALWASLKGPAGVVLAFSALVTVLQAVTFAMAKTKSSAKETKDEIRELRDELQKLTREQLQSGLARAKTEFQAELFNVPDVQRRQMLLGRIPMTDELKRLDERIKAYEKEIFMLGDIENVENRLRINRQRLKDLNKDNLALYKDVATTYDDIKNRLEQWIRADERALKVTKEKNKELQYGIAISREAESRRITFFGEAIGTGQKERQNLVQPSLNRPSATLGKTLADNFKETNKQLNFMKTLGGEVGDILADAFTNATLRVEDFIRSLSAAIIKMFIFKAIEGIATGGASAVLAVPAVASPKFSGGGGSIEITGTIESKQNKFVVDIARAEKRYVKNLRLNSGTYIQT